MAGTLPSDFGAKLCRPGADRVAAQCGRLAPSQAGPGGAGLAAVARAVGRPIPGTTELHRLSENLGAAEFALTPQDLARIEDAAAKISVQGARYPERIEKPTGLRARQRAVRQA